METTSAPSAATDHPARTIADDIVDRYLLGWNETDPRARRHVIESTWTSDARSVDPLADVRGHDEIDTMIAATQAQFPGHRFERTTTINEHHDALHWGWRLVAPDRSVVVNGFDVATMVDGRISWLVGFFE